MGTGSEAVFGFLLGGQQVQEGMVCSRLHHREKALASICNQTERKGVS